MPYLSPPTLTAAEQRALLDATAGHPRDHLIFSVALGTGLRLGEIVGLNVGDVFFPDGSPRLRVKERVLDLGARAPGFRELGERVVERPRGPVVGTGMFGIRWTRLSEGHFDAPGEDDAVASDRTAVSPPSRARR